MFNLQNTSIMNTLSPSWISGNYANIDGYEVSICTALSYASFENLHDENLSYFFQGNEAEEVIEEILDIWSNSNIPQHEAISQWITMHL